jgi:hypothetical protein
MPLLGRPCKLHEPAWTAWSTNKLAAEQCKSSQDENDGTACCNDMEGEDPLDGAGGVGDGHCVCWMDAQDSSLCN